MKAKNEYGYGYGYRYKNINNGDLIKKKNICAIPKKLFLNCLQKESNDLAKCKGYYKTFITCVKRKKPIYITGP